MRDENSHDRSLPSKHTQAVHLAEQRVQDDEEQRPKPVRDAVLVCRRRKNTSRGTGTRYHRLGYTARAGYNFTPVPG
jgi:hypothetical protein